MKRSDRPRLPAAVSAAELIQQLLQRQGLEEKAREYRAWQIWDEAVGPQIARQARPLRIRDGVLEVRVSQPVWMQQLQLMKPKILARINNMLDGAPLRDIYFRRGAMPAEATTPAAPSLSETSRSIPLTEAETARVDSMVEELADPQVRDGLRRLLIRQAKLDKARAQED